MIALIGAGTLLLAATAESMWHANAAALEGGLDGSEAATEAPASAVSVAGGAVASGAMGSAVSLFGSTTNESSSTEEADPEIPRKDFKPFVLVRIPYDTGTYSGGEVLGISNNGVAVGYLVDASDEPQPFMFVASTNTVTMLDMDSGTYDYGAATSVSADGEYIAGVAHDASTVDRAVVWDESQSYAIAPSLSPSVE